jgi:hypothetical protein
VDAGRQGHQRRIASSDTDVRVDVADRRHVARTPRGQFIRSVHLWAAASSSADNARPGRVRHVGAGPQPLVGVCRGICRQARVTTSCPPAGVGGCVGLVGVGRVGPRQRGFRRGRVGTGRPPNPGCDSPTLGKAERSSAPAANSSQVNRHEGVHQPVTGRESPQHRATCRLALFSTAACTRTPALLDDQAPIAGAESSGTRPRTAPSATGGRPSCQTVRALTPTPLTPHQSSA